MSALAEFLEGLFSSGEVILRDPPFSDSVTPNVRALLRQAFDVERLQIAGPLIEFDAEAAVGAATLLWRACWFLLAHEEPPGTLELLLVLPPCNTASAHLSADLTLRYVPQIYRRARSRSADDILPRLLATVLREWPLSGVLSEIADEPLFPVTFGDHPGLMLLYAERLADHSKSAWVPTGRTWEYLELVYQGKGINDVPTVPNREGHVKR
jgi:hypothetical protein